MATDIFNELVRAALNAQGYLTFENAIYWPNGADDEDRGASCRIDLIAFHPRKMGHDRILAVTVIEGSDPLVIARDMTCIVDGSEEALRELVDAEHARAFRNCIGDVVGGKASFTHVTAARTIEGDRSAWTGNATFSNMLRNPLTLWDFHDIVRFIGRTERFDANHGALRLVELFERAA